ncbi:MAG TPA: LacI family DNA-binding transcriptional regulator [Myxococcota bacterium]|nr:LacI family DNA-binding transcriptional regulator [Myxococcota bacterium]HOH77928.1 LacI family DNA-binding transcriptional regulator [Myxococcota bacterium]
MAATIKQIAGRLNVSVATVSRALNDLPGVGEKMRRKVRRTAAELGYVPDFHARALVSGKVPFLGLVVPDITNSFFPALALAVEEAAAASGQSLILLNTNWRRDRLAQALELLSSRRVSGLIVAEPLDAAILDSVDLETVSNGLVLAGVEAPGGTGLCSVMVDDRDGGMQVGRHLVECGAHRIAFVGGPSESPNSRDRLEGLTIGLGISGGAAAIVSVTDGAWTEESGYRQADRLLRDMVPDAIFAANDLLAIGVMRRLVESGIAVGRGVALAGYDDTHVVSLTSVPITSVAQPTAQVGSLAVKLLGQMLSGDSGCGDAVLKPSLVARSSTLEFSNLHVLAPRDAQGA